jgi:hypothetical protein
MTLVPKGFAWVRRIVEGYTWVESVVPAIILHFESERRKLLRLFSKISNLCLLMSIRTSDRQNDRIDPKDRVESCVYPVPHNTEPVNLCEVFRI